MIASALSPDTPNIDLEQGIAGLLELPNLEPEARALIELALEAQKTGEMPDLSKLKP